MYESNHIIKNTTTTTNNNILYVNFELTSISPKFTSIRGD